MEEELDQEASLHVDTLHLVRSHVLSLLEFEDVFLAVDDLEGETLRDELGNIASPQPPVLSDGLLGHLFQLVVPLEDLRASDLDFPSGSGPSLLVDVLGGVSHFGQIGQSDLGSLLNSHTLTPI